MNWWKMWLDDVAELFREARALAATGRPGTAAFILTLWALATATGVSIIVVVVAGWMA